METVHSTTEIIGNGFMTEKADYDESSDESVEDRDRYCD